MYSWHNACEILSQNYHQRAWINVSWSQGQWSYFLQQWWIKMAMNECRRYNGEDVNQQWRLEFYHQTIIYYLFNLDSFTEPIYPQNENFLQKATILIKIKVKSSMTALYNLKIILSTNMLSMIQSTTKFTSSCNLCTECWGNLHKYKLGECNGFEFVSNHLLQDIQRYTEVIWKAPISVIF